MERLDDVELVKRAQRGDRQAFAELFLRYEGRILGYVCRMVGGDMALAEDLTQDAFIRAHEHLGDLKPPYHFKAWLYRIAGNLAIDALRRRHDEITLPDWDAGETRAPEPVDRYLDRDPERQMHLEEVRKRVEEALRRLPERYRQILLLRELEGLSYQEIAAAMDLSLDNVKVTLYRARVAFRDAFGLQVMMEEGRGVCHELDELLSAAVDQELDRAGRRRVKKHLKVCPICRRRYQELLSVSRLVALLPPLIPPATLRPKVLRHLQEIDGKKPTGRRYGDSGRGGGQGEAALREGVIGGGRGGGGIEWVGKVGIWVLGGGGVLLLTAVVVVLLIQVGSGWGGAWRWFREHPVLGTPTVLPVLFPTATPTVTPTEEPLEVEEEPTPTHAPPLEDLGAPSSTPTYTPTPTPSATPSVTPTLSATPTVTPTPSPEVTPTPLIMFWSKARTVPAGTCTMLYWRTERVQAVYLDAQPVPLVGEQEVCPCERTVYVLDVLKLDGNHDLHTVTIEVTGSCDTQGPAAPVLLSPVKGVRFSCTPSVELVWSAVTDPSGIDGYTVELEVLKGEQVGQVWRWDQIAGTNYKVPTTCGTVYRWRARAVDGAGNVGVWSDWEAFTVRSLLQ